MTPRDRMSQRRRMRSASQTVTWGQPPSGFALPSTPLVVSPSPRRRGETLVTLTVLLKSLLPGQELLLESP